jgi:transposase
MRVLISWNSGYTLQDAKDGVDQSIGVARVSGICHEINESAKTLKLWVRRKRGNRKLECSGCGRKLSQVYDIYEREVRDLPWSEFRTTVVIELYRVRCPDCGVKTEKVPQLPSKAPFSKRFEEAVGLACESAAVRRVVKQFGYQRVRCVRSISAI